MGALRDDLHKLIDDTADEELLEGVFMILSSRNENQEGQLWNNLTEDQKQQVLDSESEMDDPSAWISNEEMKQKNAQWLG